MWHACHVEHSQQTRTYLASYSGSTRKTCKISVCPQNFFCVVENPCTQKSRLACPEKCDRAYTCYLVVFYNVIEWFDITRTSSNIPWIDLMYYLDWYLYNMVDLIEWCNATIARHLPLHVLLIHVFDLYYWIVFYFTSKEPRVFYTIDTATGQCSGCNVIELWKVTTAIDATTACIDIKINWYIFGRYYCIFVLLQHLCVWLMLIRIIGQLNSVILQKLVVLKLICIFVKLLNDWMIYITWKIAEMTIQNNQFVHVISFQPSDMKFPKSNMLNDFHRQWM